MVPVLNERSSNGKKCSLSVVGRFHCNNSVQFSRYFFNSTCASYIASTMMQEAKTAQNKNKTLNRPNKNSVTTVGGI
jgi:hypothetical protein